MYSSSSDHAPRDGALESFVLRSRWIEMRVLSYGAIVTSLTTPDREGHRASVVLGHEDVTRYHHNPHYLGAVVGRYANRIEHSRFHLGGTRHQLAANDGPHHLHGGVRGFDRRDWVASDATPTAITFTYVSPAGEEHYPGTLRSSVTYRLSAENVVEIRYHATTDRDTLINLTQHSYFNLSGDATRSVLDHELSINADAYHAVDATLIPEGPAVPVTGTPFDFRQPRVIGEPLAQPHEQLARAGGFDHNWVLNKTDDGIGQAATLRHPRSGRRLEIATTEPGLQFYDGHLLGSQPDDEGQFAPHSGLCLETQHFPDSPNRPEFPSTLLCAGEDYASTTTWTFSLDRPDRGDN